jgi:prepilin-type N-terminal cleavage/methylation domain-containing protein
MRTEKEKGLTAIELLIAISILALIIIFTAPMITRSNPEFEEAIKITESSVEQARKTARYYKTDVLMRLETDRQMNLQSITLSIPDMQKNNALNEVKEAFPLPAGVHVSSEAETIQFNHQGEVKNPANLLFESELVENASLQLVIR